MKILAIATGIMQIVAGFCLFAAATIFTVLILRQFKHDTKFGPLNEQVIIGVNTNLMQYEFGPMLYWAYVFGGVQVLIGLLHLFVHPYNSQKSEFENENGYSEDDLKSLMYY